MTRWFQEHGCSHEHSKEGGAGETHCVQVQDKRYPRQRGVISCASYCQGAPRAPPDDQKMEKARPPDAIFQYRALQ